MASVHQLIIGASRRDAITNMSLRLRDGLKEHYESEVFSYFPPETSVKDDVTHFSQMPAGSSEDLIVYHSSFGLPELTPQLLSRTERLVIVYHNITPSSYYVDSDPDFAFQLLWGRKELELIRNNVVRSFAVSEFNAADLRSNGYSNVTVIPAGVDPRRLECFPTNQTFLGELNHHFPQGFVLFVSQVLQHKRVELAIQMIHLLRSVWRLDLGLVVAGPIRKAGYFRDLNVLRERLPESHVLFTNELSESDLATAYRACSVYLGTSDHEGLAIPPLEAMAAGAPVVARATGAIPETVKDAGVLVPADATIGELTATVARVIQDEELRISLIGRGYERVAEFEKLDSVSTFVNSIRELFP